MDNLICTECGTTYYSAAARAMVARVERCDCGSALRLIEDDDGVCSVGVGLPHPTVHSIRALRPVTGRRFAREG